MQVPHRKAGQFSNIKADPFLTEEKLLELKNKLDHLKKVSRPRSMAEVARLAELGDFSENVAYQMAKGQLRGINDAIENLEDQINKAVVIKPQRADRVELGHKVTISSEGEEKTYQILGSSETSPGQGIISHNSPIGSALMGRRVGEIVKIKLKDKEVEYKISKIE